MGKLYKLPDGTMTKHRSLYLDAWIVPANEFLKHFPTMTLNGFNPGYSFIQKGRETCLNLPYDFVLELVGKLSK